MDHTVGSMDRVEEALLAFVGTGEVEGKPMLATDFEDNTKNSQRMTHLIETGYVEREGDSLIVTTKGWRFLDRRSARGA